MGIIFCKNDNARKNSNIYTACTLNVPVIFIFKPMFDVNVASHTLSHYMRYVCTGYGDDNQREVS